jgi:Uma2 family endonuclease
MIVAFPTGGRQAAVRPDWYSYLSVPLWRGGDPSKPVFEEVAGTRVEKKMGAYESGLANSLNAALDSFVRINASGRSYVGMEIEFPGVGHRRKPDVVFVSNATWPIGRRIPDDAWWAVTPDLAVESVSPYELTHATMAKVQEYFAAGVKAVWLILPNVEQVYCYSSPTSVRILTRDDDLTGDLVIPGFRMRLADLFPEPEPEPAAEA